MIYDEFKGTKWKTSIDVEDFIKENYTEFYKFFEEQKISPVVSPF